MISKKTIILIIVLLMVFLLFITLLAISTRNIVIIDLPAPKSLVSPEELERREKRRELEEEKEEAMQEISKKREEEIKKDGKPSHETIKELVDTGNKFFQKELELMSEKEKIELEERIELIRQRMNK